MAATPKPTRNNQHCARAAGGLWIKTPDRLAERMHQFMLDGSTGQVLLHIRDGEVLKAEFNEHIRD